MQICSLNSRFENPIVLYKSVVYFILNNRIQFLVVITVSCNRHMAGCKHVLVFNPLLIGITKQQLTISFESRKKNACLQIETRFL